MQDVWYKAMQTEENSDFIKLFRLQSENNHKTSKGLESKKATHTSPEILNEF